MSFFGNGLGTDWTAKKASAGSRAHETVDRPHKPSQGSLSPVRESDVVAEATGRGGGRVVSSVDMVNVVAEATDGVSIWYAVETVPAHQYDHHEVVRVLVEAAVMAKLGASAPDGLNISIRVDRWVMWLSDDDEVDQ